MGQKTTGVYPDKDGTWQVDKQYKGERIRARGFSSFAEADAWLAPQLANLRQEKLLGHRPERNFDQTSANYLLLNSKKISLESDMYHLKSVMPYIGNLPISKIDDDALKPYIADRLADGIKHKTINLTLGAVRLILNLAATTWKHANNQYWLDRAPKLTMLPLEGHQRPPMPISWDEQSRLLDALPIHLKRMALFTLNTCVRDDVVCNLQWSWEVRSKQLPFSVFEVPKEHVKGQKSSRLLVCNSVAMSILDSVRGMHPTHVFVYRRERVKNLDQPAKMPYRPIKGVSNTAWETAREKAGLGDLHFHDLRHTASTRLGSQKVSQKAISEILWHGKKGTTEHYQAAVMMEMRDALELISKPDGDIRHLSWGMVKRAQKWEENSPIPPKVPHDDSEQSAVGK
jgi:integrase